MKIIICIIMVIGFSLGVYLALRLNNLQLIQQKEIKLTPYQEKLYEQYYRFK